MALVSPGVQVSVIDESFYTPAEPGTVPMIFVASASNKINGSGTGTAPGTLAANAGKPYLLTSQRELAETFGDPTFYTDANNNPVHGGELNEYGLQAAYSLLGISSRVYVTRADVDLGALNPQADEPTANPASGTYWLDTDATNYGIFAWNGAAAGTTGGQSFSVQQPVVITEASRIDGNGFPKQSEGAVGSYAIKATTDLLKAYYRVDATTATRLGISNQWVELGSSNWKASWPVTSGTVSSPSVSNSNGASLTIQPGSGSVITIAEADTLTDIVSNGNTALAGTGITLQIVDNKVAIFNDGSTDEVVNVVDSAGLGAVLGITAGAYRSPELQISKHTTVPLFKTAEQNRPTGSVWVKTTEPNLGARWRFKVWNDETELFDDVNASLHPDHATALYNLDRTGGGFNLPAGTSYVKTNVTEAGEPLASFRIYTRSKNGATAITGQPRIAGSFTNGTVYSVTISESDAGATAFNTGIAVSFTGTGSATDAELFAGAINGAGFENVSAVVDSQNRIVIAHAQGGEIRFTSDTNSTMSDAGFSEFVANSPSTTAHLYTDETSVLTASNWKKSTFTASGTAPASLATDGALWYSSVVDEVDMLAHNGTTWVGYKTLYPSTDSNGPIVSATEPTKQSDGATNLQDNDLWIDTSNLENYPTVYRYSNSSWVLVDTGDQTTEEGILFADARYGTSGGTATVAPAGTIVELLASDYLDPDAPDPALYPKGMLLWNLRRSGFNVKRFERDYIDLAGENARAGDVSMSAYYPHRWVTESPNQADGSGSFGRKAQRSVVVKALQATLNSNDDIRDDESRIFNVMATPAYPELIGEMVSLNYDRGLSAFIVGDSPMRLTPDATSLNEWGQNVRLAVEDNDDGLVSFDEYMGVYYPAGFTSDNVGNNVVVPASHMALRTIALSDQVSYPWFAPAGTRRGGVTNATATGYISNEGEFVSVALNEGQRDTLYSNAVNPITFLNGSGLVVFGQKTRARNASALDRINVARLVIYMRSQLNKLAKPYLFEPNDKITRDQIKNAAESLCLELVGQRALYDYLVVCDESNNTPSRIDRNELYLDIAIEPVKAVEFIYIPLRLKNTGEIAGLG